MSLQLSELGSVSIVGGNYLYMKGNAADCAYIIASGCIAIIKHVGDVTIEIARLYPGELVGDLSVIQGKRTREHSALAVDTSRMYRIPAELLRTKISSSDPFVQGVIRILMGQIRDYETRFVRRPNSLRDSVVLSRAIARGFLSFAEMHAKDRDMSELVKNANSILSALEAISKLPLNYIDKKHDVIFE